MLLLAVHIIPTNVGAAVHFIWHWRQVDPTPKGVKESKNLSYLTEVTQEMEDLFYFQGGPKGNMEFTLEGV